MAKPKKTTEAKPEALVVGGLTVIPPAVVALPTTKGTLAAAMEMTVSTKEEEGNAHAAIKWLKGVIAEVNGAFKDSIDSANKTLKDIKALRDKIRDPFVKAEEHVREALADYGTLQRLMAEAAEEEAKATMPASLAAAVHVPVETATKDLRYKKAYSVKVVNPFTLALAVAQGDLVPEAVTIDTDWINMRIKQTEGKCEVPGVEITCEWRPVVR